MKKLFSILAITTLLFLTSCESDDSELFNEQEKAETFEEIQTDIGKDEITDDDI
jgi:hypothetical protein